MRKILQVFFTIFSAFVLALAIPNEILRLGSPVLGFFALAPLYAAVRCAQSLKSRAFLAGIHCATVNVASSFWLANFRDFAVFTLGAPTVAYFFWGAFIGMCLHFAFCEQKGLLSDKREFCATFRIFGFASVWTMWEWSKSTGFLAYPWGTLSMTTFRFPALEQIADLTGTFGITFLLALFSAVFAEFLIESPKKFCQKSPALARCAALWLFLFATALAYGGFRLKNPPERIGGISAMFVQQNVDPWEGGAMSGLEASEKLTEECKSRAQKDFDIVLWSESSLNFSLPRSIPMLWEMPEDEPFLPFIQKIGAPFLVGAPVVFGEDAFNAVNYFDKNGEWQGFYAKMQLVPFAEIIPGQDFVWVQKLLQALVGFSRGWTQGREWTVFPVSAGEKNFLFSAPICFEDAFPTVCRGLFNAGSDIFVNLTNDSWSRTVSAELQHFVVAHFRAIEFRTTLARSTNSGYSCVISPQGNVVFEMPLFEPRAEITEIPVFAKRQTVYAKFGNWLPALFLFAYFAALCKKFAPAKQKRTKK